MAKISEQLETLVSTALEKLEIKNLKPKIEPTADFKFGEYTTNVALVAAKTQNQNSQNLAQAIKAKLEEEKSEEIQKIEIAGPGFINFYLSADYLKQTLSQVLSEKENYGLGENLMGQKVLVEYTDPNPFKLLHIGHLMSNTIGESLTRLLAFSGAEVKRACYQGDVGMHVAKALWGVLKLGPEKLLLGFDVSAKMKFLGEAYAAGAQAYEEEKTVINELNHKIYEHSDEEINKLYDEGKKVSLEYFEQNYKILGTKFDFYFFESETGKFGKELVEEWLGKGVFEESDGAIIFRGENHGTHNRVFITSGGLPTYEAKELGLAKIKYDKYPYDLSVVVTGNEVNDYFKVLLTVLNLIFPALAQKTKHLGHGMLRLPTGKMSSRTGEVITAESLIEEVKKAVAAKMTNRDYSEKEKEEIIEAVAIAAIKYSILKQDLGKDIIFDFEKSISFEGASGPYLQYAYVRTQSILEKKKGEIKVESGDKENTDMVLEKMLEKFPVVVKKAATEYGPQQVCTYLVELASAFNAYYANYQIIGSKAENYRLALAQAVGQVIKNGLNLLGIKTPTKM